ncbi:MAG TPA: hypothetical protein VFM17_04520, partial [Candidatus Eisenbacteria bacterium]|nr:hypothetical protein [Candidatus Eisenbacteria bacterium]
AFAEYLFEDAPRYGSDATLAGLADEMKTRWPAFAHALRRSPPSFVDSSIVADALVRSERDRLPQAARDLVRWAAHQWLHAVLNTYDDIDPMPPTRVRSFLAPWNVEAFAGHYGGWYTNGALVAPLLERAGENRWTDQVFLRALFTNWDLCAGVDSSCAWDEGQPFHRIIRVGESFLANHPRSTVAGEVRLLVARAHETGWSCAKAPPSSPGSETLIEASRFILDAPHHREQAIRLYEEHLRQNPTDPRNRLIRRRLARIRLDLDTGCRAFVNYGVC